MELIIGNKNYSSWSLRGWLMLKAFVIPFQEKLLLLDDQNFYTELEKLGVAGKVPVLIDESITLWDSLAICEYINETYLEGSGWPSDAASRAEARSVACEMHSGFASLRDAMPMNCRARRKVAISAATQRDIDRIDRIWSGLRHKYSEQGPFLFGSFSIADVMFAPVVSRFQTYGVEVSEVSARYMKQMLDHPHIRAWYEDSRNESAVLEKAEAGEAVSLETSRDEKGSN